MARRHVDINEQLITFEPKTEMQAQAMEVCAQNSVTFLLGPAGTAKTHTAVAAAIKDVCSRTRGRRKGSKIIITRPIVEAGESLGYLPGEMEEKVRPYMMPIFECVEKMVANAEEFIEQFFRVAPLAYMRGATFTDSVAILDEAQNCTMPQMKLFLSRLGYNSKLIVTGDPEQTDIGKNSALMPAVNKLIGLERVGIVRFTEQHNVRDPLVSKMLAKLNN